MRALLIGAAALIAAFGLPGCGGGSSFHGTLPGADHGPQPANGEPMVTGVSPASVMAGGPSFTLTVTGTNFAQGDVVEWDSAPLSSTFISSTEMTALVPNKLLYEPGAEGIIVQTPVPYPLTFGTNITITSPPPPGTAGFTLSTVNVQANDMAWDPNSKEIYLSIAGTDPLHPNTIASLDPATGQFGASVSAGPGADHLGVSSDGSWLYAGIDSNGSVQRFALPTLASDITIPLGSGSSGQPYFALDLEPAPGSPNTIAVARATSSSLNTTGSNVAIFDGTTARPEVVSSFPGPNDPIGALAWNSSGSEIFATFNDSDLDNLFVLSVNSAGVQLAQSNQLMTGSEGFTLGSIHYSALTGYLYAQGGSVIDTSKGTVVAGLPMGAVQGGVVYPPHPLLTLDDNLGIAWTLVKTFQSPNQQFTIEAFDLRTDVLLGSIAIPNVVGTPIKLIRWGSNGLAFLTSGANGPQQGDGVYIVSGEFVTKPAVQDRNAPAL